MNIVHVVWNSEFGGIQRFVSDICDISKNRGHNVKIIFCRYSGGFRAQFSNGKIDCVDLKMARGYSFSKSVYDSIIEETNEADVIHLHDFNPFIAAVLIYRVRRPIVFTEHGNFVIDRSTRLVERFSAVLYRLILRSAKVVLVANSQYTKSYALNIYGKLYEKAGVIYNGVKIKKEKRDEMLQYEKFNVLLLGRVVKQKGFQRVLRLLPELKMLMGDINIHVVGDGPYKGELVRLVEKMGMKDYVVFMGYQSDIEKYIYQASMIIVPSVGEPFGLVAIEALALGKRIAVYSDGGGLVEIASMLPYKSIACDDSEMIELIFEEYNNRGNSSTAAVSKEIAKQFSLELMFKRYSVVYERACRKD
ncbi:MAG TPA: glycosyltransferase family 4 protein [Bacteroidota bacterium]|nr:glycosyltransferase family 4 protein [Bacteroidota bacterium]